MISNLFSFRSFPSPVPFFYVEVGKNGMKYTALTSLSDFDVLAIQDQPIKGFVIVEQCVCLHSTFVVTVFRLYLTLKRDRAYGINIKKNFPFSPIYIPYNYITAFPTT